MAELTDRVAKALAWRYGVAFDDLREEPENADYEDYHCKAFWRDMARVAEEASK